MSGINYSLHVSKRRSYTPRPVLFELFLVRVCIKLFCIKLFDEQQCVIESEWSARGAAQQQLLQHDSLISRCNTTHVNTLLGEHDWRRFDCDGRRHIRLFDRNHRADKTMRRRRTLIYENISTTYINHIMSLIITISSVFYLMLQMKKQIYVFI